MEEHASSSSRRRKDSAIEIASYLSFHGTSSEELEAVLDSNVFTFEPYNSRAQSYLHAIYKVPKFHAGISM